MSLPTALFLDKASLYPEDLDFSVLEGAANWQWFDNASLSDIHSSLTRAEVIATNKVELSDEIFDICQHLKLVCVVATGVNNIDLVSAEKHNVQVCNVRAYATASVAQHVFSLLLSLNRHLSSYQQSVVKGAWSHSDYFCYFGEPISELQNKVLGLIGFGELGQAVAKIAKSFGMNVLVAQRNSQDAREGRVPLRELLSQSDVVSLHCPLTEDNYHFIDEEELALMKTTAIIINTARGGLINEAALLTALKNKTIAGAALDVLEQEPPSLNHELIKYQANNLIVTPHIAWASKEARQRLINEVAQNIKSFSLGEARNLIVTHQ